MNKNLTSYLSNLKSVIKITTILSNTIKEATTINVIIGTIIIRKIISTTKIKTTFSHKGIRIKDNHKIMTSWRTSKKIENNPIINHTTIIKEILILIIIILKVRISINNQS